MLRSIGIFYTDYLAQDKPLRHDLQHILCGIGGYALLHLIFAVPITVLYAVVFFLFTFLPDLDGFFSLYRNRHRIPAAQKILDCLAKGNFKEASTLATVHHKKFNNLYIHNIFGFFGIFYLFFFSVLFEYELLSVILTAVLTHFIFDWGDDFYQLGHGYNWLWPVMNVDKFNHEARHPVD